MLHRSACRSTAVRAHGWCRLARLRNRLGFDENPKNYLLLLFIAHPGKSSDVSAILVKFSYTRKHRLELLLAQAKDFEKMKLTALNCPSCGARLQVDPERIQVFCSYCGAQIHIDDEVRRFEHKIEYSNAEEAGYQFEKGRQRAMAEAARQSASVSPRPSTPQGQPAPAKRKTWLWVLGWIFIFPVPFTILMLRKKDLNPAIRYGVIAIAWIVYFIWSGVSSKN